MEKIQKANRLPNPRKGANILSAITFSYTFPTFLKGFRRDLDEKDIPQHLEEHASHKLGDKLEESWRKEKTLHQHPSLWRAIARAFGLEFMFLGVMLVFLEIVLKITQTLALAKLITYYTQSNKITEGEAYIYASLIVGASFLNVLMGHNYMMSIQNFGMKLRVACCSIIYRKSLRLSKSVLGETTIGQMVNLLSNDVNRCDTCVLQAHNLWVSPIEIIIIFGILYNLVGAASTAGVIFIAMFIPLQMYLGKKTSEFRLKTALRTDERIRLMSEIISGIQVIKMYTWEQPFAKLVATVRRLEIHDIRAASYIKGLIVSFAAFTTRSAIFLTIVTYVLLGNSPKAEYVFIVTSFYNILRQAMTVHFPGGIMEVAQIRVSVSRLQKFLLHEESEANSAKTEVNSFRKRQTKIERKNIGVQIRNASAKWFSSSPENTLNAIDFEVNENQLVALIGPVGSGKSSLLNVILKELSLKEGDLKVEGSISYASQEPWVFSGTVQQNILFGLPLNSERYQEVIRVCALEEDFSLFPHGDETLVGERGVMLSGGQRARISLARAIYKEADIYLLDDPLSAVDAKVGKQLFENCIQTFLKYKCTVLVTHQLQYLQNIDSIYLTENGKITMNGTYNELKESGIDFTKHLCDDKDHEKSDNSTTKEIREKSIVKNKQVPSEAKEQRSSGHISGDVYASYFKAGGSIFIALPILLIFILTQLSASSADFFLAYWVNMEQVMSERDYINSNMSENSSNSSVEDNFSGLPAETCIYIYSGITLLLIVFALARSFSSFAYAMKASTRLHANMFSSIVRTPMQFFNTNSSGRILNRFSKDTGAVDEALPMIIIDCLQIGLTVIGVTVLVSLVNPWLLIETGIILGLFYSLRILYLSTSRSVKRLEGIARSPVFAHLSASLQGLTTIRAFGVQGVLQDEFDNHQDFHSASWHLFLICTRAFGFWLDLICVVYIGTVTFSFLVMKKEQYGGNVGLAITQAISLTGLFQWGMRQWSELENQMTSVERIVEYTKTENEVDPVEKLPPPNWPENGNIEFKSVSLRYSPTDPYVLRQLTFSIKAKEKIGIVGRTGAGKSSLIYALFQLAQTEGLISIDDIDIAKVPLNCLRSKISIIPQEPVLFSGSLRKNLDPFDEYTDADLWNALEEVELKHVVNDLPSGLNDLMSEGGSNFSVGQRQLVCLARAIIRKNKILVLDEATANVDPRTDALIQSTLRRKFSDCTVLTIAHRLHTVMDSDKILVMDAGRVAEFDHPYLLLRNDNSLFFTMVQQTGQAMAANLLQISSQSYESRNCR